MDVNNPFSPISSDNDALNSDELIRNLQEEIVELRRRLHLYASLGNGIGNRSDDGPMASIIYFNTKQSWTKRRDIEASCVGSNNWYASEGEFATTAQESSIDIKSVGSSGAMLKAVGAIEYYNNFCVDRLGVPVAVDVSKEFAADYVPPAYRQVYPTPLGAGTGTEVKKSKPAGRSRCFNCGGDHVVRDCPLPKNMAVINQNRSKFEASTPQFSKSRYHADDDGNTNERFSHFSPGSISDKLCNALGISKWDAPPYISRMRQLGYPPGYMQHQHDNQDGVLALYDDSDIRPKDNHKMIQYPGFNCPLLKQQGDHPRNHKRRRTEPAVSVSTISKPLKIRRSSEQQGNEVVDMDISDEELEEGEINTPVDVSATSPAVANRRHSSSSVDTPVLRNKRFSLDFPPSVLSSGEDTPTTPHRWNSIKCILDRSKT